jgi:hypothetical protein
MTVDRTAPVVVVSRVGGNAVSMTAFRSGAGGRG